MRADHSGYYSVWYYPLDNFDATNKNLTVSPTRSSSEAIVETITNDGNGSTVSDEFKINIIPINNPATGEITLVGKKSSDNIITANALVSDNDGLRTFNYQWFSDGVWVQDSNSNNYKILASDS